MLETIISSICNQKWVYLWGLLRSPNPPLSSVALLKILTLEPCPFRFRSMSSFSATLSPKRFSPIFSRVFLFRIYLHFITLNLKFYSPNNYFRINFFFISPRVFFIFIKKSRRVKIYLVKIQKIF